MKKTLLAIAISTAAAAASADYQLEAGAFYGQGELGAGNAQSDYDLMGVAGRYNFESVDTSKGPHAEAAFLDKSSSVGFGYISREPDAAGTDDVDSFDFDVRVVTDTNLIIEAAYEESEAGDDESDTFGVGVGTYLNDTTDIVVSYQATNDDSNRDEDADQLNVVVHGVNPLTQGATLAYDAALSYIDGEDDDGHALAVGATYYFNKNLGVGLSADLTEVGDDNTDTVTLDVSYFPQPNIELMAAYFDQGGDEDIDGIMFGAAVRF